MNPQRNSTFSWNLSVDQTLISHTESLYSLKQLERNESVKALEINRINQSY